MAKETSVVDGLIIKIIGYNTHVDSFYVTGRVFSDPDSEILKYVKILSDGTYIQSTDDLHSAFNNADKTIRDSENMFIPKYI